MCVITNVIRRQIYEARKWREEPLYQAICCKTSFGYVFVRNIIKYMDPVLGQTITKIERFFVNSVSMNVYIWS